MNFKINPDYKLLYDFEEITGENGKQDVFAAFTTRHGGVSCGYLENMNMSFNRGDSVENVLENYNRIKLSLNAESYKYIINNQVHGNSVRVIKGDETDFGYSENNRFDASITNVKGVLLTSTHADCTPVLFYDKINKVIGAAHSGWKGTVLNIVKNVVSKMYEVYGSKPEDILTAIGPCICKECYQVGEEVYSNFRNNFSWIDECCTPDISEPDHYKLDMRGIINRQLALSGIPEQNIKNINMCTSCNPGLYYSHRRDKGMTGAMSAIIGLR